MSKRGRKQFATRPTSPHINRHTRPSSGDHPYGREWPEIAKAVKKRDGYRCRAGEIGLPACGAVYKPPFHHLLEAHHVIPYAKIKRHITRYIVTLCKDCHYKTHGRMWGEEITTRQKIGAAKFK